MPLRSPRPTPPTHPPTPPTNIPFSTSPRLAPPLAPLTLPPRPPAHLRAAHSAADQPPAASARPLARAQHIALQINEEADLHNRLLGEVHEDVDATSSRLRAAQRRLKTVMRKGAGCKTSLLIFLLAVILVVVLVGRRADGLLDVGTRELQMLCARACNNLSLTWCLVVPAATARACCTAQRHPCWCAWCWVQLPSLCRADEGVLLAEGRAFALQVIGFKIAIHFPLI